jgi:hypothetical protein
MRSECEQCGRKFNDMGSPQDCCPQCCEHSGCSGCGQLEEDTVKIVPRKKLDHSGSSYYVTCPYCEKTNWLSYQKEGDSIWCEKCAKQIKIGSNKGEKI